MKIIGLDLSLTGAAVASDRGWCERVGQVGVTRLPLDLRLDAVDLLVDQVITLTGQPDLVVIELPAFSRAGGGSVERHAMWWLVVRRLRRSGIPVAAVPPSCRARYATGKGSASKSAVVDAIARRLPMFETGGDDNLADAAVLVAMGADHLGVPMVVMPQLHRAALAGVEWPVLAGAELAA